MFEGLEEWRKRLCHILSSGVGRQHESRCSNCEEINLLQGNVVYRLPGQSRGSVAPCALLAVKLKRSTFLLVFALISSLTSYPSQNM